MPAPTFQIEVQPGGAGRTLRVTGPGRTGSYPLARLDHAACLDLFEALAADFGLRPPAGRRPSAHAPPEEVRLEPVLTSAVCPEILYGYGDPCVLHVPDAADGPAWYLVVTSNDAPQSFPILRTTDLRSWERVSFAFPAGTRPAWALDAPGLCDLWAPELHRVRDEIWLAFTARGHDGVLAIGLARASAPEGPFTAAETPLLGGGVIDPHILVGPDGAPILFWKQDDNDRWPGLLADLLVARPHLVERLFPTEEDRRTAALVRALRPWISTLAPMERFFVLQNLIEAVTADLPGFEARLALEDAEVAGPILEALTTRVFAQQLAPDGLSLVGERHLVLQNDQAWEAHLIEGVWVTRQGGRYWLFYAANDFSTADYGIGVAVADAPFGPYEKLPGPILRSSREWSGPGHPSVATGADGAPRLFLHAHFPGVTGYKAFRAVLACRLSFERNGLVLS